MPFLCSSHYGLLVFAPISCPPYVCLMPSLFLSHYVLLVFVSLCLLCLSHAILFVFVSLCHPCVCLMLSSLCLSHYAIPVFVSCPACVYMCVCVRVRARANACMHIIIPSLCFQILCVCQKPPESVCCERRGFQGHP